MRRPAKPQKRVVTVFSSLKKTLKGLLGLKDHTVIVTIEPKEKSAGSSRRSEKSEKKSKAKERERAPRRDKAPAEGRPVDLLLVAVKATVLEQAIQDIAKFVGPDTVILSVLNGITSEEHIDAAYPGHTLWSVAIGMDATRTGRTLVFNQAGKIQFGERSGEMTDRVQAVADYLDECGIANEPCGDILYKQWNKLMVNDGLNQAAAAFDQPYGGLRQPGEAQDMMRAAMQEVIRLANLEGVSLPPDNDVRFIDAMMPTFNPEGMPSMRQDGLAKRPTEVEEFAGVVRQRAKKYGMPTPANDFFYTRIREIEAGYDQ